MPMNMALEVPEAFVIQLERMDDGVDGLGHRSQFIEKPARLIARKLEQLARMMLREQDAIAAIELPVAEHHERMIQLRDEVGSLAGADIFENRADSTFLFKIGHLAPMEPRPASRANATST